MTIESPRSPSENTDLKTQCFHYFSYWYFFVICTVLALAFAYGYNELSAPVYQAKASIIIHEDRNAVPLLGEVNAFYGRNNWFNETALLKSHTLVSQVLSEMQAGVSYYSTRRMASLFLRTEIYLDSPFRVHFDADHPQVFDKTFHLTILDENQYIIHIKNGPESFKQKQLRIFGQQIHGPEHDFVIEMVDAYDPEIHQGASYAFVIHKPSGLASRYRSNVQVDFVGEGYSIVDVSFTATHKQRAIDFLSQLSDMYIHQNLEEKNLTAENTIRFIDDQLAMTSQNLHEAEHSLQRFRENEQVIDLGIMAGHLVNELLRLDKQRSIEEVKRQYYHFLLEYLRDDRAFSEVFGPSALGIDDPLLNNLLIELSKQYAERSRLLLTSTEQSPAIQALDREIMQARGVLAENIRSMQTASDINMNDLDRRIRQIEHRIGALPGSERELIGIERRHQLSDAAYNFLMQKRADAGIALATNTPDHKIMDAVRPAGQVSPNKQMNYWLAVALGLGFPLVMLTMHDFFNTRVTGKAEVEHALGLPIVGLLPRHKMNGDDHTNKPVIYKESGLIALEAFRSMRSNLHYFCEQCKNNLIVVTSTRAREGKTYTALNLAGALALAERRTILINTDMRKVASGPSGDIPAPPGLSDYLNGKATLVDILQQNRENEYLFYIESGTLPQNPAEILESETMAKLLHTLRDFDHVIIDTPPLGLVSDAQPLLAQADMCVFVVRHRYTRQADLDFIRDMQQKTKLKNLAVAVNRINTKNRKYGYHYGYYG